jgi:hypothetical protein
MPYREVSEPDYAQVAAETFVLEEFGFGVSLLGGRCPRCQAAIQVPVVDRVVRTVQFDDVETAELTGGARAVPIICTCTETHPGRPVDQVGCGAYWIFNLPARS